MLRTALLLACLVAAASAQSSAKISLSLTRLTLKKDSSYNVKFTLDEPIICPDQSKNSECAVVIEIDNHAPAKVAIDNCIIKWNWDEWAQPRFLRVSAVENFVNEGELKFNLVTKPAKSDARYYKDFNPADIEIVTQPNPSAACSGTGDPHYWTFDRQYWHVYTAGRYVLYSNRDRADNNNDFEIQVQTYAYPARHCGFAAKEGNDIVVFPCGGGHRRSCGTQECQRGGFPKVSVSGCWVTVTFKSGRQFKRCGTGFYAYAPGRDYKNGVQGICGNFNGNNQDDSPCGGCKLHNLASLFDGQRPDRDLFNWYPTGIVSAAPKSPHVEECTYVPPPFRPPILTHPDAEDITDLIKDVQKEDNPDPVEFDFTDAFAPEPEPMDRDQAEDLCVTTIRASAVARACLSVMPDFDLLPFIEDCTDDLAETSDEEFIAEAIEDMERGCARVVAAGDTDGWERDNEGQPIPPEELRDSLCPATTDPATGELKTCNNHGTCKDVVCTCEEGFVGADCGVETGKPPVAVRVLEPFCDTRTGKGCGSPTHNNREGKYVTVQGTNIFNTDKLVCRFARDGASTIKTDGFYLGSTEALCAVPDISLSDFEPLTYTVSLSSDDGATYGESTATFTWYDAICDVCELVEGKEQCKPNPDSCTIKDQCHLRTQPSDNNICLQCIPEESTTEWSYNYDNHVECGPSFADSLLPVTVLHADAKKDQVIITLDASNPLTREDDNYELTYTIVKAEDAFAVDSKTGAVSLTRDIEASALPSSFSNLIDVRVEDQAGNFASVGIVVDFVTVNQQPAFPEGGFAFTISEKAQKGDVVGTAEAQDADDEERFSGLSYQISSAPIGHDSDFVIDSDSGAISVNTDNLDFETFPLYSLHIRATDNGGQFHVTEVKIQLEDAPEPPTAIELDTNELEENAAAGTVVGMLSAEDPEGGDMTFAVVGGDATGFAISDGNKLVSTRAFDFEAGTGSVSVEVQAKDATQLTFSQAVVVAIVDVNEAPRVLGLEQTTFSEASSLTRLTKVLVEDDDNSADPNKQIVACTVTKDDGDYFEISQNSLVLVKKLDHEAAPTVTITVVCADDGEPTARSEPRDFVITVTNANDAPEKVGFVGSVGTQEDFTVPEDHDAATPFGTLTATDHDADSSAITFSLEGSRFELVGAQAACVKAENGATTCTQEVRLAEGEIFDYETAAEETLVVSADEGAVKSVTNVRIVVTNVNEPPTGVRWVNGADSISEDAQNGDLVGQLLAVDEDAEQQYTFTLKKGGDVFYIDTEDRRRAVSNAATIRVKDASKLNFEESSSFALEVEVKEDVDGGFTMTAETEVAVTDAPVRVFAGAAGVLKVTIDENVAIDTVVTELVMTGDDRRGAPWNVDYALAMTDDSNGHFKLEGTTVKVARIINRELLKVRPFEIEVTASAANAADVPTPAKSYHEITVDIDNVDEAPEFGESAYSFSVNDDEGTGKTMTVQPAAISAVDPDENAGATIYNMAEDTAEQQTLAEYFVVDPATGVIKTRKALASALEGGEYSMVVRATAGGLTSEVTVTVTVVDDCADNACFSGESCVDLQFDYQCCSAAGSCINKIQAEARNPQGSSGSDNSAGTGMIIGIVVAALVLIVLVAIIVVRRRNDRNADSLFKNDDNGIYTANPTYRAPSEGPQYAAVSRNPHFVPGVSNPMYDWYKPDMTRQECTEVLMGSDDGTFVVRDSKATPGWHMLGVKAGSSVVHEKIKMNEDGMYELLPASNARQPRFADVPALVAHYGEPRDDVPYVLTLNFSNPMYGMGAAAPSQYQYAPGVALPNDPAAPHVPLKEKEKDSVAQLAAGADIYGNTAEARIAMGSDV